MRVAGRAVGEGSGERWLSLNVDGHMWIKDGSGMAGSGAHDAKAVKRPAIAWRLSWCKWQGVLKG